MGLFRELFAWWTGNTIGTRFTIWKQGKLVGEDELGNRYFLQRRGNGPLAVPRRWVVYKDLSEASKVSPAWHGWLHHTIDHVPDAAYQARAWERPHEENPTGSPQAKRPGGSILARGKRQPTGGDYRPWRPE